MNLTETNQGNIALILGSAPSASEAVEWTKPADSALVSVNNSWQVRPDWDYLVHAGDFPEDRRPQSCSPSQTILSYQSYVPAQNRYGGFVYAGGTMAFTAGYWALDALKPRILAYFASDMVYAGRQTHFYGTGDADPLRDDVTLRSLEAKSARLMALAARQGCACVNLSTASESRLIFPRTDLDELRKPIPLPQVDDEALATALEAEHKLGYLIENGEYWHHLDEFDAQALSEIDRLWLKTVNAGG